MYFAGFIGSPNILLIGLLLNNIKSSTNSLIGNGTLFILGVHIIPIIIIKDIYKDRWDFIPNMMITACIMLLLYFPLKYVTNNKPWLLGKQIYIRSI